jgi:hypothetical protein
MKNKIACSIIIFLLVAVVVPISVSSNINTSKFEELDKTRTPIENIGFVFTIGNFTETEEEYQGHFIYYLFFGIIGGEFYTYSAQDEILILNKDLIIREYITSSRIIFARVVPR